MANSRRKEIAVAAAARGRSVDPSSLRRRSRPSVDELPAAREELSAMALTSNTAQLEALDRVEAGQAESLKGLRQLRFSGYVIVALLAASTITLVVTIVVLGDRINGVERSLGGRIESVERRVERLEQSGFSEVR